MPIYIECQNTGCRKYRCQNTGCRKYRCRNTGCLNTGCQYTGCQKNLVPKYWVPKELGAKILFSQNPVSFCFPWTKNQVPYMFPAQSPKWLACTLGSPNADFLWSFNFLGTFCYMKNWERINFLHSLSWKFVKKTQLFLNTTRKNQKIPTFDWRFQ